MYQLVLHVTYTENISIRTFFFNHRPFVIGIKHVFERCLERRDRRLVADCNLQPSLLVRRYRDREDFI